MTQDEQTCDRPGFPDALLRAAGLDPADFAHREDAVQALSRRILELRQQGGERDSRAAAGNLAEQEPLEEALRRSEEMQRRLLQAVPDLIIKADMEGTITFVNEPVFPWLDKVTRAGIHRRNIFSVIAEHDLPRALKNARLRLEKNIGPQEYQVVLDSGIILDTEINGAVIRDKDANPIGMVYVIRDITKRKRAEQERDKLQARLLQSQKMESLGILVGGVAHEFNNLLQAMHGNTELLLRDKAQDHPDADRLRGVLKSLDRATHLVEQMLLFSRTSGVRGTPVDVNREARNAVRILEASIPAAITLDLRLDPGVGPILADPAQIEQILLNLADNAVDAMPHGGRLTIETAGVALGEDFVRAHAGASVGPHVLLSVSDTGLGMDETTLKHIFDPFFTTKQAGQGAGLGLASVYGMVQAHGGHVHCRSEPGRGTTFRVYLPAGTAEDKADEEASPPEAASEGGETILVVDDDPEVRELTREVLESLGYAVKTAASGEDAVNLYAKEGESIDLVLLDLNMPGMGGHKCLKELLRLDPQARALIVSGYTDKARDRDLLSSGAKGFVNKPYRLEELADKVRETLE